MDNQLQKWQNLWQHQKSNSLDIDKLISQLNKMERTAKFQRIFVPILFSFAVYLMVTHLSNNLYNILSISLIVIGILFLIVPLLKNRDNLINDKFDISNQHFIDNLIKKLKQKVLIPKRYMLIFSILLTLAFNIAFLEALRDSTTYVQLFAQMTAIILFIILLMVRKYGIKRYEKQIFPLIKKLEKINKQ